MTSCRGRRLHSDLLPCLASISRRADAFVLRTQLARPHNGRVRVKKGAEGSALKHIAQHLFALFVHLGGLGLLAMGILDSSFLIMPFGNDLLLVAMTARKHELMPYYAA